MPEPTFPLYVRAAVFAEPYPLATTSLPLGKISMVSAPREARGNAATKKLAIKAAKRRGSREKSARKTAAAESWERWTAEGGWIWIFKGIKGIMSGDCLR
jgi:hypothetical protein